MNKEKQIQMIRQIAKTVSDYFGLTIYELVSKTRKREIVSKRQIAQELSYSLIPHVSLESVGFELGRQDHATVLNSIKVVGNLRDSDKTYSSHYYNVHRSLMILLFPVNQNKEIRNRFNKSRNLKSARIAAKRHNMSYNLNYAF